MTRTHKLIALITVLSLLLSGCGYLGGNRPIPGESNNHELGFIVYFLDVGQADSALIVCDGATMLIDGGNAADSDLVYSFLEKHGISHLDYIVATHVHEDHVGGLSGALNFATAGVALSPVLEYDSRAFNSFVKYLDEQGIAITVPAHGDTLKLGSADVLVVGPADDFDDPNNTSIVLKVTYGKTSFLFTGDVERQGEQAILDAGHDISATVLKVAHHGSDTSTTHPFLYEAMPEYAVISVGKDNSYGHPHENTLSRLRDADVKIFRTDMQGIITCTSDGKTVSFTVERNADAVTNPTQATGNTIEDYYIVNVNTKKVHRPSCSGLPKEENRVIYDTLDEAYADGFSGCGTCKP